MAYRMQGEAQEAFDLGRETPLTRQQYGDGEFAHACLIARRLAERGVRHDSNLLRQRPTLGRPRRHQQPPQPRPPERPAHRRALEDLKSRGLLDGDAGGLGRRVRPHADVAGAKGRDHHSLGFSMWLAGGGVKGGTVYGATDEFGFRAVENRLHNHDLHATILHLMGLDHEKLTYRYSGRDFG